jgi:long-chain acyl-CoA synthetase
VSEPKTFDQAVAAVTGPGGSFEVIEGEVDGRPMPLFAATPPSIRSLVDLARMRSDGEFLIFEDERWTFGAVADSIDRVGAMLVDRYGVEPGDRVGIAMRNYPEWVTLYLATVSIGAIAVAYNAWWTTEELDFAFGDSEPTVVFVDAERLPRIEPLLADAPFRVNAVRADGALPDDVDRWAEVLPAEATLPEVEIDPDANAHILYTSGTTDHPKGAISTHRAVLSALLAFGARAAVASLQSPPSTETPTDRTCYILCVPLFHITGLVPVMLGSFTAGFKLVMMYKWDPARALELIERERITVLVGVPTMSWDLLESPDFDQRDTSSLVSVGGGGAPAPPELVKRIEENFRRGRPSIGYGMTETNAYGPQNTGDDYVAHPTSTGRAVPIMQVAIFDDEGRRLAAGEQGEIRFRGPMVIRGYWKRPEATAETLVDGWLRSGDIGRIDDEGFVYVEDRAKDMVLRGGENIGSAEVEAVLYQHPAVYEAAVFGIPHHRLGEELVAAVMVREGAMLTVDEIRDHVGEHLAPFKVPTVVEFYSSPLPRNANGKIMKRALRDDLIERRS